MVKEGIKSPKSKPKFTGRSSRNGDINIGFDGQMKKKMGFNKEFKSTKPKRVNSRSSNNGERNVGFDGEAKEKVGFNKEFKSPRGKPRFDDRGGNNAERNGGFDSQFKRKLGFNKDFESAKSKPRIIGRSTNNGERNVRFDGEAKRKISDRSSNNGERRVRFVGEEKRKMGFNNEFKSPRAKTRINGRSSNNGESNVVFDRVTKDNPGFDKEFRKDKKQITTTPSKDPFLRTGKSKLGGKKKKVEDDSAVAMEGKRRRKKMGIRIDPYDTSNKRLDDGVMLNDTNNQKKKEEKKKEKEGEAEKVELSMNAQFRAIKPSPSILSYVEDNLLGRRRDIELRRAGYNTELSAPLDNIPFSTSSERERIEESIFRNRMDFFAAAKSSSSFPPPDLPEIAFAGRSNVGKSSLLNSLTRQWGVVRTSDKPGHTQSINFFKLGTKLCLVDLPGYGFAYAKEEVKEAWEDLVKEYVSTRIGLKKVCLLIDTKWGMKPRDYELIHLMERSQTKYQIILTKTDIVFPIDVARRAMQIEETLKANKSIVQPVMMVSSKSGAGIRSFRTVLTKVARFIKP